MDTGPLTYSSWTCWLQDAPITGSVPLVLPRQLLLHLRSLPTALPCSLLQCLPFTGFCSCLLPFHKVPWTFESTKELRVCHPGFAWWQELTGFLQRFKYLHYLVLFWLVACSKKVHSTCPPFFSPSSFQNKYFIANEWHNAEILDKTP